MTVELAPIHLVGDCGILLVVWLWVLACGAGVVGADIKAVCPAMVHVVKAVFVSVAFWWSDAV